MDSSQGLTGRIFVLRLHSGEILHESVERFAMKNKISSAYVMAVGGADEGSRLTVGPKISSGQIEPIIYTLDAPHELTGNGTIFRNGSNEAVMHMHCSCGREGRSVTGCVRSGVKVWLVMEVVITEIIGTSAKRAMDPVSGFELLVL